MSRREARLRELLSEYRAAGATFDDAYQRSVDRITATLGDAAHDRWRRQFRSIKLDLQAEYQAPVSAVAEPIGEWQPIKLRPAPRCSRTRCQAPTYLRSLCRRHYIVELSL